MTDSRKLVRVDERFPASLSGDAGKQLMVRGDEQGYEHGNAEVGVPVGSLLLYLFNALPVGYIQTGATYNYDDYPALGAMFGSSAGGTFDVPEILFIKNSGGVNTGAGESAEVGTHGHTADEVAAHGHSVSVNAAGNHTHSTGGGTGSDTVVSSYSPRNITLYYGVSTGYAGAHGHVASAGSGGEHTPVINDHAGTNQPECTLVNIGIKF